VTFCDGGSVSLTSSAEASYLWSNAASTQSINATKAGSYTVQVTSADGCQSALSDTTIVTVNTLPSDPTITADGPTSFCEGGNVTLTSSFGTGYLWSNGATVQSINVANSGNFTAQTSNVNGCMSNSSPIVKVTVNSIPQVNISSSSSSLCISDQRNLTGNPSGGTFTILSGPGIINGNILSATGSGTINLEYFYSNNCSNKAIQSINVDKNVIADAGPDQKLLYVFETQMAAEFPQYGTGEWSLISGSGDINDILSPTTRITGLSIGENKFIWKVSNGSCVSSDEVIIEVSDIVTPTVITPNEDGLNDELIFPGLQAFPGSSIMIYNRWGSEVYRNSDYKNDWKGKDKNNRDLQPDTYYYILRISNGRIIKGFIEIRR
jgi:gliding motility-associated-like protein